MHFKCAMCPHEFCSGCYNPFVNTDAQVLTYSRYYVQHSLGVCKDIFSIKQDLL